MNKIIIELCQEDRERLDLLNSTLIALGDELKKHAPLQLRSIDENGIHFGTAAEEHPVDAVVPHADPVGEPGAAGVDGTADPEPAEKVYQITKADIMAKVQALAAPNNPKREQAKAIVKSYGAKVSDIPEDKYDEVMAKLVELEG